MLETGMFRRSFVFKLTAAFTMLLGTLIDGIVIGSVLGAEAMAAYGLINPVVIAVSAFFGAVPIVNMLSGANSSAGMLDMGCRYLRGLSGGVCSRLGNVWNGNDDICK